MPSRVKHRRVKHASWCRYGVIDKHDVKDALGITRERHHWCLTCEGGVCPVCKPNAYADKSKPYVREAPPIEDAAIPGALDEEGTT